MTTVAEIAAILVAWLGVGLFLGISLGIWLSRLDAARTLKAEIRRLKEGK